MSAVHKADFKPEPRVIEDKEGWEVLRRLKLGPCRVCGNNWLPTLHHLVGVGRGKTGDDVPANLVPLCKQHHQLFHAGDEHIAAMIGASLTVAEIRYVLRKKDASFLSRRYFVDVKS